MKALFSWMTRISLRFRALTFAVVIFVMITGTIAASQLKQELLPPIEFPQTFILASAAGMTSDQALKVVTSRVEAAIAEVPEVVNISSTTNGAFGAFIIAANDFGLNQQRLQNDIKAQIETVWFPQRAIKAAEGEDPDAFAVRLMNDLTPEVMVYLGSKNSNLFFQLSPEAWAALPDATVNAMVSYLAQQQTTDSTQTALERIVEQEVVPQLNTVETVARVQLSGGQTLPGEDNSAPVTESEARSLLLQLSPDVWAVITSKVDGLDGLDATAVTTLSANSISAPATAPALPESWQMDRFSDATDLQEMAAGARSTATVLNDFLKTGRIIGALGTTEDLTPEVVQKLLEIDASLVEYFEADHLVAMAPDVFAMLPDEYISSLDGFTRDALAAKALANSITGVETTPTPVTLPNAWRIQPPQILSFGLGDIPLATFSVFNTSEPVVAPEQTTTTDDAGNTTANANPLGGLLAAVGGFLNSAPQANELALSDAWSTLADRPEFADKTLATADDLLTLGAGSASSVLNQINSSVPQQFAGYEVRLFNSLTPAIIQHFAAEEADFFAKIDPTVLLKFSPDVLKSLPEDVLAALDAETSAQITAIGNGDVPSAAAALADLYTSDVAPADPDAPVIPAFWEQVGGFMNVELDTADDFFRFPADFTYSTPVEMMNGIMEGPGAQYASQLYGEFSGEAITYILERDPAALNELRTDVLQIFPPEVLALLPDELQQRAAEGGEPFRPTNTVTRTNGASSLLVTIFKDSDANTIEAFYAVKEVLEKIDAENENIAVQVAFEQSSLIEESISGVVREGALGALFAIIVILVFLSGDTWSSTGKRVTGTVMAIIFAAIIIGLTVVTSQSTNGDFGLAFNQMDGVLKFLCIIGLVIGILIAVYPGKIAYPAWRSTLVIAVSIPLSVFAALALMHWLPPVVNNALAPMADSSGLVTFILRLFPEEITLNIMTLSGLTVAIGRVVDDSIVVLENIFRQIQKGMDKREAIISGTRDVSVAIFAATGVAVVVFLPLGLTGGLIGSFFLPFGLAVTYALLASFIVAITVVPVLAYLFVSEKDVPHEERSWMERVYEPALIASQRNNATRWLVVGGAMVLFIVGILLFGTRPFAFIPSLGEPQIAITVAMPQSTKILETAALVQEMEAFIYETLPEEDVVTVRSIIGGGGLGLESLIGGGGGVTESQADITIAVHSSEVVDEYLPELRTKAEEIFGVENVTVSGTDLASGGLGGFELVMSGADQATLAEIDPKVIEVLNSIEGLTNVTSNLALAASAGGDASVTYIRNNQTSAVSYSGELETEDTIGVTNRAIAALKAQIDLPEGVTIGQGFNSELQTQGFAGMFVAMGIAVVIVVVILVVEFGSPVYWGAVILSILVAPVGAAVMLTVTNTVLGISALIGLLMLLGLAVTNAVVLIDRVGSNRNERGMNTYDAIIEAGERRMRPIVMTAVATIFALIPLAIGHSEGAIIADSLGKVVIGGMFSSTLLTLIVVPAAYYLATPLHDGFMNLIGRRPPVENNGEVEKHK